jgi:putative flippase GtrA
MRIVSIPVNLIGQAVILVIMYMFVSIPVNLIGQAVILVIMYITNKHVHYN